MPIYDFSAGATSGSEIGKIYDFAAGDTSGHQIGEVYDFAAGATSGSLIYKSEIELLNGNNANTFTITNLGGSVNSTYKVDTDGSIYLAPSTWLSSAGDICRAYKKMTDCTGIRKVTIRYSCSKNDFDARATYFEIVSAVSIHYYDSNGTPDSLKKTTSLGSSAKSNATVTFTFDSATDLSNYYFLAACTVQAASAKPWLRLYEVIVE